MDNKRKHSATNNYARTKSIKSNTDTENARGTSSAHWTDSHRVSLPTIVLNMANLQEQNMSDVPSAWFDNNSVGEVSTFNNSINDISSDYDVSDDDPDDELIIMDDNDTTKHPNEFQYSDDEFNTTSSECSSAITSVSQQDNVYDHYQTKNDEEMNNSRSNTSSECSSIITLVSQQDNGYDYYQTKNDEEMNNSRSNTSSECSSAIASVSHQDNGYDYYPTNNDEDINNSSSNSSKEALIGSIVLTSVREQENGCFVYLNEYDEAMNEIRSEMYKIVKPTMTSNMEQSTFSFAAISPVGYLNRYNGGCTQQPTTSSGYDDNTPLVILCSKMQDHIVLPNVSPSDDETSPKVFIQL